MTINSACIIILSLLGGDSLEHVIIHTLKDGVKLLPFLFLAFLIIEVFEHKFSNKSKKIISKSGRLGPLFGSLLGCFPQCGFSVIVTNLYVTRIVSMGTLIAVYLSTSDEMLPILISNKVSLSVIVMILLIKFLIGIICGLMIDMVLLKNKKQDDRCFEICHDDHCHCETGVIKSSLIHTLKTFVFVLLVTFVLNLIVHFIGENSLSLLLEGKNIMTPFISGLVGLIPNCVSSVILTELFVKNIISIGSLIAGLLTGCGVAMLVLFKTNKSFKDSIKVLLICYGIGVLSGLILNLIGFNL